MSTTNTKTFLLFQPKHLFSQKAVVTINQLIKTPHGITTGELPFSSQYLQVWFKKYSDDNITALLALAPTTLQKIKNLLDVQTYHLDLKDKKKIKENAISRHLYSAIATIRRQQIKDWYHTIPTSEKKVSTAKCSFHSYPVEIIFYASKEQDLYNINIWVEIGKEKTPLQTFNQYYFLLEKEACYYQVSPDSYQSLSWFQEHITNTAFNNIEDLALVLQQLDSKHGRIERIDLDEPEAITVIPENKVWLSELNNTFLKLEPQFLYDGYMVDGPFEPITKIKTSNGVIHINRHKEQESEFVAFLRSLHEKFANQNNGFFYLNFAEAQKKGWFVKTYHHFIEKDIALLGIDLLKNFRYSPHIAETKINNQSIEGDFIKINFSLQFGTEKVPLLTLQKALLNNQKAVLLKDGSLGILSEEWQQQFGLLVRHGKIKKNELHIAKWLTLAETTEDQKEKTEVKTGVTTTWLSKWEQWKNRQTGLYPLPAGLQVKELRPYQITGYEWLRLLAEIGASGCLADDMGLGKTLQTISFLLYKIEQHPQSKHLVVAPASLLYNWFKEIEKFSQGIKTTILHGTSRDTTSAIESNTQIIITSYGTMRQDIALLGNTVWDTIVLDESHNIKNPAAQTTKAAWELTAKTKIALSGTPIMNSTSDLHSQIHFLLPGLLGSTEFFKKEYAMPIELQANEAKAASLQKLIRPFLLRRTKEQVAKDLPERTESILWCEMGADQRSAYNTIKEAVRSNIFINIETNGLGKGKLNILAGLTKLRQLCNSCELVKNEDLFTYDSVKTQVLINEIKSIIPQHRVLVFSQFTSMLDLLERDLNRASISTLRLDGQTKIKKRQELVTEFQSEESNTAVFLISLKAGNTGLTLTQADYVFLFDPWWNTAVESQAIDRTHRIGQTKQVFAYRMICRDSIEERIIQLSGRKKKLSEELISTEESFVKSLTLEDIQFLLT